MIDRFLLRPLKGVAKAASDFGTGVFLARVRTGSGGEKIEQRQRVDGRELSGLLPICAYCHAIRDDSQCWRRFEEYVTDHFDVTFTHGICPKCHDKVEQDMVPRLPRSGSP